MFLRAITALLLIAMPAQGMAQNVELSVSAEAGSDHTASPIVVDDIQTEPDIEPDAPKSFDDTLTAGHDLYAKGDMDGAKAFYHQAKQMKSSDPLVYYFIASVEARQDNLDAAIAALTTVKAMAGEKIASLTARALFMTAAVEERRAGGENAAAAWQAYKDFVTAHTGIPGFVQTANARLSAIEKKQTQYQQYEVVRQRISTTK